MAFLTRAQQVWAAATVLAAALNAPGQTTPVSFDNILPDNTGNKIWGTVGQDANGTLQVLTAYYGAGQGNYSWSYALGDTSARFLTTLSGNEFLVIQSAVAASAPFPSFLSVLNSNTPPSGSVLVSWQAIATVPITTLNEAIEESATSGPPTCEIPSGGNIQQHIIFVGPNMQLIITVYPDGGGMEMLVKCLDGEGCWYTAWMPAGVDPNGFTVFALTAQSFNGAFYYPGMVQPHP